MNGDLAFWFPLHQMSLELFHQFLTFSPSKHGGRSERQRQDRSLTLCSFFLLNLHPTTSANSLSQVEFINYMHNSYECMGTGIEWGDCLREGGVEGHLCGSIG